VGTNSTVNGNLTLVGDVNLGGSSLYINGTLTLVGGGVTGSGSIYANGNVSIQGGTSIFQTNQSCGAALFSSGTITMGPTAEATYINVLTASAPSDIATNIANDEAALQTALGLLNTGLTSGTNNSFGPPALAASCKLWLSIAPTPSSRRYKSLTGRKSVCCQRVVLRGEGRSRLRRRQNVLPKKGSAPSPRLRGAP